MELFDKIKEKFGEEAESFLKSEFPKYAVPKDQYNKKVEELKAVSAEHESAKKQMEETASKISQLEQTTGENAELKKQLETISGESEKIQKRFALEKALLKSGAIDHSVDLLLEKFDVSKMTLKQDGSLDGFDSQLEPMKQARSSLFKTETVQGAIPEPSHTGGLNANNVDPLKQQFDALTAKFSKR